MIIHTALLVWLAPIAFFDRGRLAQDWTETLIPFGALMVPLVIAIATRSAKGYGVAALIGVVLAAIFFIGPGVFLLIPALCYACAGFSDRP
jgi:hypothetical protein